MSQRTKDEGLSDYLKAGNYLKKDGWLKPMHVYYNPNTEMVEFRDYVVTQSGNRVLCVREKYASLDAVPYVGEWVKCNEHGEAIE